jgi:hypothetical protein
MTFIKYNQSYVCKKTTALYGGVAFMALMLSSSLSQAMEDDKDVGPIQVKISSIKTRDNQEVQDERLRIRCLWDLNTPSHRAAALEMLEKRMGTGTFKDRLKFLEKLGEFLKENPSYPLELDILKKTPSAVESLYKKTLAEISVLEPLPLVEKELYIIILNTFYKRILQHRPEIGTSEFKEDTFQSLNNLMMDAGNNISLLYRIRAFQGFYGKEKPDVDALENTASSASRAKPKNKVEEVALKRLAAKIFFKLGQVVFFERDATKTLSHKQSHYGQASLHGHTRAKYFLAELLNKTEYGAEKSEFYHPQEAYTKYLEAANDGSPLAAYALAKLAETGDTKLGIYSNKARALVWHEKAAAQGHPLSQYALAIHLMNMKKKKED